MSRCSKTDEEYTRILQDKYGNHTTQKGDKLQYLGLHLNINKDAGAITLSQSAYTQDLLTQYGVTKGAATPACSNLFAANEDDQIQCSPFETSEYKSKGMKLMYLGTRTRSDILLSVSYLMTKAKAPTKKDMAALDRVFRYLYSTKDHGLTLQASSHQAYAWADASFGVHANGRSHTGMLISIGENNGAIVLAKSKKQTAVSKSSTEAELLALNAVSEIIIWFRNFLNDIGFPQRSSTVYQDNKSTIMRTEGRVGKKGNMRHLNAVKFHWLKEMVTQKNIHLEYMPTGEMIADILTKPLQGRQFHKLCEQLLNARNTRTRT